MQTHASWRDEIGWILAVIGAGALSLTIIDLFFEIVVARHVPAWLLFLAAVVLLALGLGMHLARPGRSKAAPAEEPPAGDAPAPDSQ